MPSEASVNRALCALLVQYLQTVDDAPDTIPRYIKEIEKDSGFEQSSKFYLSAKKFLEGFSDAEVPFKMGELVSQTIKVDHVMLLCPQLLTFD